MYEEKAVRIPRQIIDEVLSAFRFDGASTTLGRKLCEVLEAALSSDVSPAIRAAMEEKQNVA
jgi:hypothetical protein